MKFFNKKALVILGIMLMVLIGTVSSVSASSAWQTIQAYRGVSIFYNGVEMTGTNQPYIINDTTYVPLRMIMEKLGSNVVWDSTNYRVLLTDDTQTTIKEKNAEITSLESTITKLESKVSSLENTIDDLEDELDEYEEDDISTSDIKEALYDKYEDAGEDYFDDDEIVVTISVSGDDDDLAYTIKLDFDDSDYDDLTELYDEYEDEIEDFLDDVEDTILDEIDGTDFEDADITGKLVDKGDSDYYIEAEDGDYEISW